MSDIPPELLDDPKEPSADRILCWLRVLCFASFVAASFALSCLLSAARAAAFDASEVYCELFVQDPDTGHFYIAEDPPWTPACVHPWVTLRKEKFQALVDAVEAGASASSSASSPFTPEEVTALKAQALTGLTIKIEPKPADPQNIVDYQLAFGLAFMALLGIWGGKQLYNVFNRNPATD